MTLSITNGRLQVCWMVFFQKEFVLSTWQASLNYLMDTVAVVICRRVKDPKSCSDQFPSKEKPAKGMHWENLGQFNPSSALSFPLLLSCFLTLQCNGHTWCRTTPNGPQGLGSAQHFRSVLSKLGGKDRVGKTPLVQVLSCLCPPGTLCVRLKWKLGRTKLRCLHGRIYRYASR